MAHAQVNITYEVKDLVNTINFYNILLGEHTSDIYDHHAIYAINSPAVTLTFIENPAVAQPVTGMFSLLLPTDNDVYERFVQFVEHNFIRTIKIQSRTFNTKNHEFTITDPNGITWDLHVQLAPKRSRLFNIPAMNSVWDILKH
jgi:hypothetical protein